MRLAIATCSGLPAEATDDQQLADALRGHDVTVTRRVWDDAATDWDAFDAVVIRSTWDYSPRRAQFLRWADSLGPRLHNSPAIVRWNSDKRYLAELGAVIPVVPTTYVEPGAPAPHWSGEVVVKPTVSAGARSTGRFSERTRDEARALIERIHASGRTAMVQPYQPSVDSQGETAVVCIEGRPSHALRKGAVLRPDEEAPVRKDAIGAAEVMYDPGFVVADEATEVELALARTVLDHVAEQFGQRPLYARVDLVADAHGDPQLMELELIEPNLYLRQVPGAVERFAAAIVARCRKTG